MLELLVQKDLPVRCSPIEKQSALTGPAAITSSRYYCS
jgi:hypothetical protein